MPKECLEIVEIIKQSRVKTAIIGVFKDNTNIMDTLQGIASWAFIPTDQAAAEMEEMVSLGLFRKYGEGTVAIYRYTQDPGVRECIARHWSEIDESYREPVRKE